MGTMVRNGHGTALVYSTGSRTDIGSVLKSLTDIEKPKTPLQIKMDELGKWLTGASFCVIVVIGLLGVSQGRKLLEVFTIAVSLAVAAIPEGLPVVCAVTLALGVLRMTKHNAIVKKLPSVEALGSIDVLCVDKTGTLTQNKMVATRLMTPYDKVVLNVEQYSANVSLQTPLVSKLVQAGCICNNAYLEEGTKWNGQPTEVAIMELLSSRGIADERLQQTRTSEVPFNPEQKWMAVQSSPSNSAPVWYCKGSVEAILARCKFVFTNDQAVLSISQERRDQYLQSELKISSEGLRVLAFAFGDTLDSLTFLGFIGMYDPPRASCVGMIEELNRARIQTIMITGDSSNRTYLTNP